MTYPRQLPKSLDGGRYPQADARHPVIAHAFLEGRTCTGTFKGALAHFMSWNVRFGSLADIGQSIRDVCFAPESRHSVRRRKESAKCQKRTSTSSVQLA